MSRRLTNTTVKEQRTLSFIKKTTFQPRMLNYIYLSTETLHCLSGFVNVYKLMSLINYCLFFVCVFF